MKTVSYTKNCPSAPYPNAATRRQLYSKVLNYLLTAASGMGLGALFLLLLALG